MQNILVHSHSGLRWVVLGLLLAAIFKNLLKWRSNAPFTEADRKLNLFTMVSAHLQLLIGLILFFTSQKVTFAEGFMKNPISRFFTMEHTLMMLIAIVLITLGYTKTKRMTDDGKKFKTAFWYFLIALLVVLAGIPWPFRNLGAAWF